MTAGLVCNPRGDTSTETVFRILRARVCFADDQHHDHDDNYDDDNDDDDNYHDDNYHDDNYHDDNYDDDNDV